MTKTLTLGSAPHIKSNDSVRKIMFDVLLALLPATFAAIWNFGFYALFLCILGTLGAEILELFIMRVLRKRKDFVPDGSAAVTGLLLALNVPGGFPWYMLLIGILAAIAISKHVFGGLGSNTFNPALVGRVFLLVSFPTAMTTWEKAGAWRISQDIVTAATPMGILKNQGFQAALGQSGYSDMFLGNIGGSMGEMSVLALLAGFAYLLWRRRVNPMVPLSYIGTVLILSSIFYFINPNQFGTPLFHLLGGGLMLGALFMATDMVTSPSTMKGALIFGVGCGAVTMLIRYFGGLPEGVSYSILIMNAFKPLIDRISRPKPFGFVPKEAGKNA